MITDAQTKHFRSLLPRGLKVKETTTKETPYAYAIAFLCYDADWEEWQVWAWKVDTVRNYADQLGQYHTDDKQDAIGTMEHMIRATF